MPTSQKRWTFELAQAFNRTVHEAVKRFDSEWVKSEGGGEMVEGRAYSEWQWPARWNDAIYEETFSPLQEDGGWKPGRPESETDLFTAELAAVIGETEVMELHSCGARWLPQVDAMREQAMAEFLNLDRTDSAERVPVEGGLKDSTGAAVDHTWVAKEWFLDVDGTTWVEKKWAGLVLGAAKNEYGCLTCQGIGGHFIGCSQRKG